MGSTNGKSYVRAHDEGDVVTSADGAVVLLNGWTTYVPTECMLDEGYIVEKKVTAEDFRTAYGHSSRCSYDDIVVLARVLINNGLGNEGLAALKGEG